MKILRDREDHVASSNHGRVDLPYKGAVGIDALITSQTVGLLPDPKADKAFKN